MNKKRSGVFRAGIRIQSAKILAIKRLGWTWQMLSEHFRNDAVLGGAKAEDFRREWSLFGGNEAVDKKELQWACSELYSRPGVIREWILAFGDAEAKSFVSSAEAVPEVKDTAAVPVASSAERRRLIGAKPVPVARPEGSVVERHQLSASAVGVSNKFAGPAKPEASEGVPSASSAGVPEAEFSDWIPSGPPVEISAASRRELEELMRRGVGTLRTEHMISYLDLPSDLAGLAPAALRRTPLPEVSVDVLIGALIYSHTGNPKFRSALARLPGASRWIGFLKRGVYSLDEAVALAREEDKQKREGGDK